MKRKNIHALLGMILINGSLTFVENKEGILEDLRKASANIFNEEKNLFNQRLTDSYREGWEEAFFYVKKYVLEESGDNSKCCDPKKSKKSEDNSKLLKALAVCETANATLLKSIVEAYKEIFKLSSKGRYERFFAYKKVWKKKIKPLKSNLGALKEQTEELNSTRYPQESQINKKKKKVKKVLLGLIKILKNAIKCTRCDFLDKRNYAT